MAFKYITWLEEHIPLAGTPKQVEWATSLRRRKCAEIQALKVAGVAEIIRPQVNADDFQVMKFSEENLPAAITAAVINALSGKDARWWIDRKDWKPDDFLQGSWDDLRTRWSEWSPYEGESAPEIKIPIRS